MDEEIELAPVLGDVVEDRIERCRIGHVAMAGDMRVEFRSQRLDALLERLALIGQRDLGAMVDAGLGDAIGDRPIVGDAQDKPALAGHNALSTRHVSALRKICCFVKWLSHRHRAPSSAQNEQCPPG